MKYQSETLRSRSMKFYVLVYFFLSTDSGLHRLHGRNCTTNDESKNCVAQGSLFFFLVMKLHIFSPICFCAIVITVYICSWKNQLKQ